MRKIFISSCTEETEAVGMSIADHLKIGDVIALNGDLGAGKTVFARGIARGLGVEGVVASPTYTIVHEYSGKLPLYHFDVYRIDSVEDMEDIGYYDYIDKGVCVIEWAEIISDILPAGFIHVQINKIGENDRKIIVDFLSENK
jgi:tRNA threonylcarbamoyladenosine biosynthesis protein TsaE